MAETKVEKISALDLASQVTDDALFPIVQGSDNYKVTMKVLKEYFTDSTIVLFDKVDNTVYIPTGNIIQGSATPEDGATIETVYVKYMNDFLQKKTMSNGNVYYYTVLPNESDFKDGGIRQDKIFFSVKDKSFFVYNGTSLSQLSIGSNGTPKFYEIMNISSESTWKTPETIITSPIADYRIVFDTSSHRFGYAGPWSGIAPSINLVFYPYFDFEGISYKMYEFSTYLKKTFIRDDGAYYTWNADGTNIVVDFGGIHVLTEEELENLQNPIEGAIYATLENS